MQCKVWDDPDARPPEITIIAREKLRSIQPMPENMERDLESGGWHNVNGKEGGERLPTILMILGWRFFFYANERNEPIHIHCRKGDAEAKYWLEVAGFQVVEAHAYNMSPADKRTVRRIIFEHFDYIVSEWDKFEVKKRGE